MALSLSAEQKSIEQIFNNPENFVIPAYQRPYSWEYDQCFQLYKDLTTAFDDEQKDYFIGNVIIAKSATERTTRYVVDGQQRLLTVWLMLRLASLLYPEIKILKRLTTVESREEGSPDVVKVQSKVFEKKDNEAIDRVYQCQNADEFAKLCRLYYNRNGKFVESRCENRIIANAIWVFIWLSNFKEKNEANCKEFIYYVLDQVFLLPIELLGNTVIEATNKALKIFETINNRGMNLGDADIFKAKLYDKAAAEHEEKQFIAKWNTFRESTEDLHLEVDDVFRYYSHIIRGRNRITSSESNLREFFSDADYSPLITQKYSDVMSDLMNIIKCLKYIEYKKSDRSEVSKWIQITKVYTNQYPFFAIVTFLFERGLNNESELIVLLKSLIRYVYFSGSTTTVKFEIYNIVKSICNSEPTKSYAKERDSDTKLIIHSRLRKGFALLYYYLRGNQALSSYTYDKVLTYKELQNSYPQLLDDPKEASRILESLGNDVIIDASPNNTSWEEKKAYYISAEDLQNMYDIKDVVSIIEKRTPIIQNTLENFFYA